MITIIVLITLLYLLFVAKLGDGFVPTRPLPIHQTKLHAKDDNLFNSNKEAILGTVLGAAVAGPFGAFFGAQLGSGLGSGRKQRDALVAELEAKGLTLEMVQTAEQAGKDVVEIKSGLEAGEEALKSFQDLAKQLEKEDQSLKDAAKMLLVSGDEASAKDKLLKSQKTKARLLNALQNAAKEKTRVSKLKENLSLVEERVMKIESNMRALSSDRLMQNQNFSPPPSEDPLLEKFRKLEEDNNNN
ncbi:hypothetical protein TrLO_g14396 [Triparma laevis f. longispina]|uniref:Uncharacterized protein n=1 Tax=Triparma laevis f. longispina TaxID=1714387 RepID=A0A9W7DNI3_9STRA|nr:hypothetical protein TrLO_g14396 [Triparma laevis f. longispina]